MFHPNTSHTINTHQVANINKMRIITIRDLPSDHKGYLPHHQRTANTSHQPSQRRYADFALFRDHGISMPALQASSLLEQPHYKSKLKGSLSESFAKIEDAYYLLSNSNAYTLHLQEPNPQFSRTSIPKRVSHQKSLLSTRCPSESMFLCLYHPLSKDLSYKLLHQSPHHSLLPSTHPLPLLPSFPPSPSPSPSTPHPPSRHLSSLSLRPWPRRFNDPRSFEHCLLAIVEGIFVPGKMKEKGM